MTGTEILRKENQALRKEIQDLKNQLKKTTDGMSQEQRQTAWTEGDEFIKILFPLVCYLVLIHITIFISFICKL